MCGRQVFSFSSKSGRAFARYQDEEVDVVGFTTCGGCPGGNEEYAPAKYGLEVVVGTHPIPQNYYLTHQALGTWQSAGWQELVQHVLTDQETRLAYD